MIVAQNKLPANVFFTVYFNVSADEKTFSTEEGEVIYALGDYEIDGGNLILKGRNAVIIKN